MYNQYLTGQLKELSKTNNSNIPEEQTNTCIEQIKQQAIDHLYQFNIELRSLNDINGIINCNITTQQYIPSFKCDNLKLNYCNINHIGTLNATPGIFGSISTTNNTNKSSPSVGFFGGIGDKIILFPAASQINYPYSIGINLTSLWNSIPSGNTYDWYINGAIDMTLTETFLNVNGDIRENNVNLLNIL